MPSNFHEDDPRAVWQNQAMETPKMSLFLIRQKARQLRAQTRRNILGTLVAPFIVAFFYVFCVRRFPQVREVLHPLFAVALAWSLVGLYLLNRGKRPGAIPEDAGFSTGLEFCRLEMGRQRDYVRRVLLLSFAPVVLALGTLILAFGIVAGAHMFVKAMPVLTLVAIWIAAYLVLWLRQRRQLWREIDELGEVEREKIP